MAQDLKYLKKLALTCRQAGIKVYKADGIEITLSDSEVPQPRTRRKKITPTSEQGEVETEGRLSDEELLMYSTIQLQESIN